MSTLEINTFRKVGREGNGRAGKGKEGSRFRQRGKVGC